MKHQKRGALLIFTLGMMFLALAAGVAWIRLRGDESVFGPAAGYPWKVFGSLWAAGDAVRHGLNPYAAQPLTWINLPPLSSAVLDLNLNPPTLLPALTWIAHANPNDGAGWLTACSALVFAVGVVALLIAYGHTCQRRAIAWAFFGPAMLDTLVLGQIYAAMFALALAAWLALAHSREVLAGVLIGLLVAIKPHYAVWPAMLLCATHWRPAAVAVGVAAAAYIMAGIAYGPYIYLDWMEAARLSRHAATFPTDASLAGWMQRLGAPGAMPYLAIPPAAAYFVWRCRSGPLDTSALALIVAVVAAPLAWFHYTVLLLPALMSVRWNPAITAGAVLLAVPVQVPLLPLEDPSAPMWLFGSIYPLGALLLLLGLWPTIWRQWSESLHTERGQASV